jgi:hypothetical protein
MKRLITNESGEQSVEFSYTLAQRLPVAVKEALLDQAEADMFATADLSDEYAEYAMAFSCELPSRGHTANGSYRVWSDENAFKPADLFMGILREREVEALGIIDVVDKMLGVVVYPRIDKLLAFRDDAGRRLEALEALEARVAGLENREDKSLAAIDERLARLEARAGAEPGANGASANGGGLLDLAVGVLEANRGAISPEQARRLQRITGEYDFDDIPF